MTILPDDLDFDGWISYVFDHPILTPQWWFRSDDSTSYYYWPEVKRPELTLSYLTRLFGDPTFLCDAFSLEQIDQGLIFLVSPACSDHMHVLNERNIAWPERAECLRAMSTLFTDLMAKVYNDVLGHNKKADADARSNSACYMWWDLIPLDPSAAERHRDELFDLLISILEDLTRVKSEAVVESALHGLGHWGHYRPDRTARAVNRVLQSRSISKPLQNYAHCVLNYGVE